MKKYLAWQTIKYSICINRNYSIATYNTLMK